MFRGFVQSDKGSERKVEEEFLKSEGILLLCVSPFPVFIQESPRNEEEEEGSKEGPSAGQTDCGSHNPQPQSLM